MTSTSGGAEEEIPGGSSSSSSTGGGGNPVLYIDAMNIDNFGTSASNSETSSTWTDLSGNNNNGTLFNFSLPTDGFSGWDGTNTNFDPSNLTFDGFNNEIDLGNASSLSITGQLSVSAWIYISSVSATDVPILGKLRGTTDGEGGYQIVHSGLSPQIGFRTLQDIGNTVVYSTTQSANTWLHVTGVFDGTSVIIYINGNLDSSAPGLAPTAADSYNFKAGSAFDNSNLFGGKIANIRVYNTVLTAQEILDLYNSEAGNFPP